jgi:hypothetical protein
VPRIIAQRDRTLADLCEGQPGGEPAQLLALQHRDALRLHLLAGFAGPGKIRGFPPRPSAGASPSGRHGSHLFTASFCGTIPSFMLPRHFGLTFEGRGGLLLNLGIILTGDSYPLLDHLPLYRGSRAQAEKRQKSPSITPAGEPGRWRGADFRSEVARGCNGFHRAPAIWQSDGRVRVNFRSAKDSR